MANSTDTRTDRNHDRSDEDIESDDRRIVAGWERQEAMEGYWNAFLNLQHAYLDLTVKTLRVFLPPRTN